MHFYKITTIKLISHLIKLNNFSLIKINRALKINAINLNIIID